MHQTNKDYHPRSGKHNKNMELLFFSLKLFSGDFLILEGATNSPWLPLELVSYQFSIFLFSAADKEKRKEG